jgi:acyl-CoA reductase-like NAD-dependent aldehyde dehydrogenase
MDLSCWQALMASGPSSRPMPLGGVKDSGWGRSGPESMGDFTGVQWITTRDGTGRYPI